MSYIAVKIMRAAHGRRGAETHQRAANPTAAEGADHLRVFIDRSTVGFFVNDGLLFALPILTVEKI
jgi:hypothetical protein